MTSPPHTTSPFFTFVRNHQGVVGLGLMLLVASALALDYFRSDLLGPRLIGLRLIYAALAVLIVSYLWLLSTSPSESPPPQ